MIMTGSEASSRRPTVKDVASADRKPPCRKTHADGLPGLRREPEQPWQFIAVGEPAAGPAGDQVVGEQQHGRSGDGGEPGGQVEEPLQAVDVEQLGGCPATEQRPRRCRSGR